MSTVGPNGNDSDDAVRRRRAETRRIGACLAIEQMVDKMQMKKYPVKSFIKPSDLQSIWTPRLLKDVIHDALTTDQVVHIRSTMLPFISFLVWIRVKQWFDRFPSLVFPHGDKPIEPKLPMELGQLVDLGIPRTPLLTFMPEQFRFIPATIEFNHREPVQSIRDGRIRLPITHIDPDAIPGGFGTVHVSSRVAPELHRVAPDG